MTVPPLLAPKNWPFQLEDLPPSAHLVGGTVRDALLGRWTPRWDLDFVLSEGAVETARAIARRYGAGFVVLDAEREIARVVFAAGTADFARQVGPTLQSDLNRRDFTANAIAYHPHDGRLVDPLDGSGDLRRGLLRMVGADNLAADPLRLLRAYRQCAQLGLELDDSTRAAIRDRAGLLATVAAERVQAELAYLLAAPAGARWLEAAWADGLLKPWLPRLQLAHCRWLAALDPAIAAWTDRWPQLPEHLAQPLRPGEGDRAPRLDPAKGQPASRRTWALALRWASVLALDPDGAMADLQRLKGSRAELRAVDALLRGLALGLDAAGGGDGALADWPWFSGDRDRTRREQYHLFRAVGAGFPALAVLAVAAGAARDRWEPLAARWQTPKDPVAHPAPPLSGNELMAALGLRPGRHVGHLLARLELARAEGKLETPGEALDWAARWVAAEGEGGSSRDGSRDRGGPDALS